jgi:predicted secreted Zn-dependent protease
MAFEPGRTRQIRSGRKAPRERSPGGAPPELQDEELPREAGAALQHDVSLSSLAGEVAGVGNPALARSLARTLGNRRFGQLAGAEAPVQRAPQDGRTSHKAGAGEPAARLGSPGNDADRGALEPGVAVSPDVVLRAGSGGGVLQVSLSLSETAMQHYQVSGETMDDVDAELPATLGEFHHTVPYHIATRISPEGDVTVTGVTLPVQYSYLMPEWTRLAEQPAPIRAAWNRFYADLMTHEREHLSVSRREYNTLRDTLRALPAEERTESGIAGVIDTSIEAQNAIHENHTGFATPSTLVFSDYIPRPAPAPGATGEAEAGTEGEE